MKIKYVIFTILLLLGGMSCVNSAILTQDSLLGIENYNFSLYSLMDNSMVFENDTIYLAGEIDSGTSDDIIIYKCYKNGSVIWNVSYDYMGYDDAPTHLIVQNDEIYVIGNGRKSGGQDVIVVKYDTDGNKLWNNSYSYGTAYDSAQKAVLKDGNLYVGAYGAGSTFDVVLLNYYANGTLMWSNSYDYKSDKDYLKEVFVDDNKNSYVISNSINKSGFSGTYDIVLLKYNETGSLLWEKTYDYNLERESVTSAKMVNNNIYILGGIKNSKDLLLLKYDLDGNRLWNASYDYLIGQDYPISMHIDSDENTYVLGRGTNTTRDTLLLKYNSTGSLLWSTSYFTNMSDDGLKTSMMVLGDNIYILDAIKNSTANNNMLYLSNYDTETGANDWNTTYTFSSKNNKPVALCYNPGKVCVLAQCADESNYYKMVFLEYTTSGNLMYNNSYPSETISTGNPKELHNYQNVKYVLGTSYSALGSSVNLLRYGEDKIAPTISINHPTNGTINTTSDNTNVIINATVEDGSTISEVKAELNGVNESMNLLNDYYILNKTLTEGTYSLKVYAKDVSRNMGTSESVEFIIKRSSNNDNGGTTTTTTHHKTLDASDSIESSNMKRTVSESTVVYGSNFDKQLAECLKENIYPDDYEITGDTIIVGGPVSNKIAEQYNDRFVKPVSNENPGENRGIIQILKIQDNSASVVQSYNVVYIAGSDRLGTEAALKYFETLKELPTEPIIVEWTSEGPVLV
ncbi:Ig-like domain-containing protein [Methanococcus voltae]|uniref:S-layer protein outer domain-containing protein n=1 Tax=Methanococcus voltae (strain ATCC BAA-1334 / A3) TaxID=456320 RepID=D7DT33_METV3|nr:Ig-like domain-containing protein [Methanococcus voltae]MCS3901851.1 hypothetical protein [Methanococcus voltae]